MYYEPRTGGLEIEITSRGKKGSILLFDLYVTDKRVKERYYDMVEEIFEDAFLKEFPDAIPPEDIIEWCETVSESYTISAMDALLNYYVLQNLSSFMVEEIKVYGVPDEEKDYIQELFNEAKNIKEFIDILKAEGYRPKLVDTEEKWLKMADSKLKNIMDKARVLQSKLLLKRR